MVQKIGPEELNVTIKFGGGMHTRASEDEIDPEHRLPETLHVEHEGETVEVPLRIIEQGPVTLEEPESFELEPPGIEAIPESDDSEE